MTEIPCERVGAVIATLVEAEITAAPYAVLWTSTTAPHGAIPYRGRKKRSR